jgi:hypothetical protein
MAVVALGGCKGASSAPPPGPPPPPDAASYATVPLAIRCAECHGEIHTEWAASAHARAATAPLYRAMQADAHDRTCEPCHTPLAGAVDPTDAAHADGVGCQACHAIVDVEARRPGAGFRLGLADNTQRGPLCDAKDHYFHKMGCAPLYAEARYCAACHLYYRGGGAVPVFTEYEEWQASPYADELACQDCHMPRGVAEVAVGWPARPNVGHHGFLGRDGRLRARALEARWSVRRGADGGLDVEVAVKNAGAGHLVPGGLPGRQLVVRVRALGKDGAEMAADERVYQRVLLDEHGDPAPFYRAVKAGPDMRIAPKATRVEHFSLAAAGAARVRLELLYRELAPPLSAALGQPPAPAALLLAGELAPGASGELKP